MTKSRFLSGIVSISVLLFLLLIGCASTSQIPGKNKAGDKTPSAVQGRQREAAEELLIVLKTETVLQKTIEQMLDLQLQQNPAIIPYKHVMMEFINKYMGYESLKDDLIRIYSETFNEDELREIIKFYRTPTGQKAIEKMPELVKQGAQLGMEKLNSNKNELKVMIEKESERIQQLQKN